MSGVGIPLGGGGIRQLTGVVLAGPGSGSQATTFASSTGSGAVVLATSPSIVTPTIASFTNATHSHQDSAGGGTLNAAAIASGALALARGGTNADLSASGSATAVLAQDASHIISARALVDGDIPSLDASKITTGTLAQARTDYSPAVILAPASSARNVIQPTGDFIPLLVRGNAAQTLNLQQWQTSTPTVVGSISSIGVTTHVPLDAATNTVTNALIIDHDTSGTPAVSFGTGVQIQGRSNNTANRGMARLRTTWTTATDASRVANLIVSVFDTTEHDAITFAPTSPNVLITAQAAAHTPLTIRGAASQSANLQEWQTSTPTTVASINSIGQASFNPVDATNNVVINTLVIGHNTSATPTTSFGTGIRIEGQSSTTQNRPMARLRTTWQVATDASRTARLTLSAFDTAERDCIAIEASGTAAMIGFLGTAPIIKITTGVAAAAFVANSGTAVNDASTFGGYTLRQIAQALVNYGLLT